MRVMISDDPQGALANFAKKRLKPMLHKTFLDVISVIITGQPISDNWGRDFYNYSNNYPYHNPSAASTKPPTSTPKAGSASNDPRFKGCVYFEDDTDRNDPDWRSANFKAHDTLEKLNDYLRDYKSVSIFRLYDIAEISGIDYQSENWGWTDLTGASIYPSGRGWILQLPPYKSI